MNDPSDEGATGDGQTTDGTDETADDAGETAVGTSETTDVGQTTAEEAASRQRRAVRERYGAIATGSGGCCDGDECCGDAAGDGARAAGYDESDLGVAAAANLGLGCGNPTALADLSAGETVLDLGSGGGFDCFLAAREVGADGRVIGVDMTPEMVERARETAAERDDPVEFRLGEIEHLPVADESVDALISNCVINLSPDKPQVFAEAHRVLRPGGRVSIADVVRTGPLPDAVADDPAALSACISGAAHYEDVAAMLDDAGFVDVRIELDDGADPDDWVAHDLGGVLSSATIEARKPA